MSQANPFESFISSLNVEGQESNGLSEQELADELAIFANAQFTFDMPPGMGIQDDKPMPPEQHHRYSYQQQQDLVLGHVAKHKHDQQQQPGEPTSDLQPLGYQPPSFDSTNAYMPIGSEVNIKYQGQLSRLLPRLAAHDNHLHAYKSLSIDTTSDSAANSPNNSAPNTPVSEQAPNLMATEYMGADDDKRRRNTAASARFRIKKKQREQALERTAKEMTEKSDRLEARVKELELEIKWLRSLLLEKDSRQTEAADQAARKTN